MGDLPCVWGSFTTLPSLCSFLWSGGKAGQGQWGQTRVSKDTQTLRQHVPLTPVPTPNQPATFCGCLRIRPSCSTPPTDGCLGLLVWLPPPPTPRVGQVFSPCLPPGTSPQSPVAWCPMCRWACRDEQSMTPVLPEATELFVHVWMSFQVAGDWSRGPALRSPREGAPGPRAVAQLPWPVPGLRGVAVATQRTGGKSRSGAEAGRHRGPRCPPVSREGLKN